MPSTTKSDSLGPPTAPPMSRPVSAPCTTSGTKRPPTPPPATLVTVAATLVVSLLLPKTYEATSSLVMNYKGVDPLTGMALPGQLLPGYMATQIDIISSKNVALRVVDQLKLAESPAVIAQFNESTGGKGTLVQVSSAPRVQTSTRRSSCETRTYWRSAGMAL